jgi:hypothetical protein
MLVCNYEPVSSEDTNTAPGRGSRRDFPHRKNPFLASGNAYMIINGMRRDSQPYERGYYED